MPTCKVRKPNGTAEQPRCKKGMMTTYPPTAWHAQHTSGIGVNHFVTPLARTTFMVNTTLPMHPNPYVRARPALPWPPPSSEEGQEASRVIGNKIWDLATVQDLAEKVLGGDKNSLRAVTRDCRLDMTKLNIDDEYAANLLLLLIDTDYKNSQWCNTGTNVPNRPELCWVPCDAYELSVRDADQNGQVKTTIYYIKLCINPLGVMVLLISLHKSN